MSDEPKYRDAEWLREQYVGQRRSTYDIAKQIDCSSTTVSRWLKNHGIETRSSGHRPCDQRLNDEEWLREQYKKGDKKPYRVARLCDCSSTTAQKWLVRHGIADESPTSTGYEKLENEEWLRNEWLRKGRTQTDIADECGCQIELVRRWLDRHQIDTQSVRDFSGENNPNWAGGDVTYGPGWDESKRREVRKRDGHTCQDPACSVTQDGHLVQYDQKLHVHHLIKARDIDDPEERNAPENLITLCRDCHQRWERLSEAGIRPQIDGVTAD